MPPNSRGNILYILLLAIILFASLSYAVTQSLRGGGADASSERSDTLAAQILQAASLLENSMIRSTLIGNIRPHQFDLSGINSLASQNSACLSSSCRMLTGNHQGTVALPTVPSWATYNGGTIDFRFLMIKTLDVGTDASDLTLALLNISRPLCLSINKALGIDSSLIDSQIDAYAWSPSYEMATYTGTLTDMPSGFGTLGDVFTAARGQRSYCLANQGTYSFFHTLIAR